MGQGKSSNRSTVIHTGVGCDGPGCRMDPIMGDRHKCRQCYNFDLCSGCFTNRTQFHNSSHGFDVLSFPVQVQTPTTPQQPQFQEPQQQQYQQPSNPTYYPQQQQLQPHYPQPPQPQYQQAPQPQYQQAPQPTPQHQPTVNNSNNNANVDSNGENHEALLKLLILLMAQERSQLNQQSSQQSQQLLINNRYLLLKEKGQGAFGKVFQARDTQQNRLCALKVIKVQNESQLQQATKEINILRGLDHPNIVQCYDAFLSDRNPENPHLMSDCKYLCIVMEYCATDLDRLLTAMGEADIKLPLEVAYSHFAQLLSTLQHIHEKNLIHRDLKPEVSLF
jgi:hypothetical protein